MKASRTLAIAAVLMIAAFAGVAVVDDSDAEGTVTVSYIVNSMTYTDTGKAVAGGTYSLKDLSALGITLSAGQTFAGWQVYLNDSATPEAGTYAAGTAYAIPAQKDSVDVTKVSFKADIETTTHTVVIKDGDVALSYKYEYTEDGTSVSGTQNGTETDAKKLPYGAKITMPSIKADTVREDGRIWTGWNDGTNAVGMDVKSITVSGDVSYTTTYRADVMMTFIVDGIQTYAHYTVNLVAPDSPSKDGFVFVGWNDGTNLIAANALAGYIANATESKTLIATFEPAIHSVKFVSNGEVVLSQTVKHGEYATKPAMVPVMDGMTFIGWDYDFSGAILEDTEIKALFEETKAPAKTGLDDPIILTAVISLTVILLVIIALAYLKRDSLPFQIKKKDKGNGGDEGA